MLAFLHQQRKAASTARCYNKRQVYPKRSVYMNIKLSCMGVIAALLISASALAQNQNGEPVSALLGSEYIIAKNATEGSFNFRMQYTDSNGGQLKTQSAQISPQKQNKFTVKGANIRVYVVTITSKEGYTQWRLPNCKSTGGALEVKVFAKGSYKQITCRSLKR